MTEKWPSKDEYLRIREAVAQSEDGRRNIVWVETIERPTDADDLALRLAWPVIMSGFGYPQGKVVFERVKAALHAGKPVYEAFHHKGKARAIEEIWRDRYALFERFKKVKTDHRRPPSTRMSLVPYAGAECAALWIRRCRGGLAERTGTKSTRGA